MPIKTKLIILSTLITTIVNTHAQNKWECDCNEFGMDKNWADTSEVTCYKIPINLIYGDTSKGTKEMAVIRARSLQKSNLQPIVYLHGGPGVATLDNAQKYLSHSVWKKLRENHDVIMMDYSGNGFSGPYLCQNIWDSIVAVEHSDLTKEKKKAKTIEFFMNCRDSLQSKNIDINAFTSYQIAADADEVRRHLGIETWNVFGVSYGTNVAMQYMRFFETSINKVVLDSPFPPNAKVFSFVQTMNETMNHMQSIIDKDPTMAKAFPNVIKDFAATADRLNKTPLKIDGSDFNGDDLSGAMAMTFYKTKLVRLIPLALKEFANGNNAAIVKWVKSQYVNDGAGGDAYGRLNDFHMYAINGFEWKPRTFEQTPLYLEREYPYLASLSNKDYFDICYAFRPESVEASYYKPIKSDLPTLVLNCEFDPGCPISYGYSTIQEMSNAKLVIVPNASHSAISYNDCTVNLVKDFFDHQENQIDTECLNQIQPVRFATSNLENELDKLTVKK